MIKEGDLVLVFPLSKTKEVIGTYIGTIKDRQVQVLLPDGYIFTGNSYDIILESEGAKNE